FFLVLHHLLYTFLLFKNLLVLTLKKQKVEMEGKGKVGSSSSSSFTNQLFGPKEPSSSSNFSSIFPPPSKGTTGNMILSSKHGSLGQCQESATCNLSSSLYYGGQDVYSGSTSNHTYHTVNKAHSRGDSEASENNSMDASRGNWFTLLLESSLQSIKNIYWKQNDFGRIFLCLTCVKEIASMMLFFIFGLGRVHFRPYTTHPAKTHHTLICLINCDLATEAFSRSSARRRRRSTPTPREQARPRKANRYPGKQPENAPLPPEEKPEVVPIIQRNLRPRKPAVVVVEDVTSSEHNELEVPNQSGSSPDKYLKLWLSEQLQNVARGIYERLETMERNICSHLGVSPPNFHNTRKRKADDDSPKTDGIQAQRPPRKSMRTNSTVTKPTTKIHFYPQRSADRLEEPRAPYAVPDESNAENPVTTSVIDEPPCISDLSPTKRFGDEKSVTVTWEETNPHAYTSGKIALASETPPSVDVETLSRDVSATKTQSAAVTEGATHDSVAVGNERSPVEEDENYESCQENISINTPLQEKHPLAVETLPGPDTDEDDNSVESGGKRLRKKSQKIREVYTPDARLKGLFMSEKKTEYRPLPKTSRAIFKKFSDILTENLVQ
ncbi:unnamed protein product, partial [Brassica oleracea]